MSSWGNYDNAANAPYWAVNSTLTTVDAQPVGTRPTAANVALLYGNTTTSAYTTGATIGLFGVDENEAVTGKHTAVGWTLRTVGTGGRAGRVQEEVLVALSHMNTDGDGQVYPNTAITFVTQTTNVNVLAGSAQTPLFSVSASASPITGPLTYQWMYSTNSGSTWTNLTNDSVWSGVTSNTLNISAGHLATGDTGNQYKVKVSVTGTGVSANSNAGVLTVHS